MSSSKRLKASARRRLSLIKQVLVDLLPDVEGVEIVEPRTEQEKPSLRFRTPYGSVPLQALGLGYKSFVALMVDLASRLLDRYPRSRNPLDGPAIVLVDEIDLHLHPKWQRTIMSYLSERFPNTQFIVTAHSPLVVQAASNANIALLRREGDHVVIDNNAKSIHGWRLDQILTSDLFGLPSARPPELDEAYSRRRQLLRKTRLTKKEQMELKG
jgi:predicted ATP-binding protein involved in virulence